MTTFLILGLRIVLCGRATRCSIAFTKSDRSNNAKEPDFVACTGRDANVTQLVAAQDDH